MFTRTKESDIEKADRQMSSLNNEIDAIQQKIGGINEQIEALDRTSEHRIYTREECLKSLDKARDRLRSAKERDVEQDATREIERVNYLRTLEDDLKRLEQEIPASMARLAESAKADDERRVLLHAEISGHQARLAELYPRLRTLQHEQSEAHQRAGEECYDLLLQGFNELAAKERDLALQLTETKVALLNKSEVAAKSLTSWPGLARRFEQETAHTLRISQAETIDATSESLKLARARKGGMVIA